MKFFNTHNYNDTILAEDKYLSMDTWKTHLNNNIMLVGASGRGKTRHFIKPNIMQMNSSFVVSDPKGVLVYELGRLLEENGYTIKVLNLVDMAHSNTYNPFDYLKTDADVYKLIDYLIANINPLGSGKADPFWDNATKAILSAIMFYLISECNPEERNFSNVMKLLCLAEASEDPNYESTLDIMFRRLKEREPNYIAVRQYAVFKTVAGSGKTAASILISSAVYLQHFNLDDYKNLTSTDNIKLNELSYEKTALFVIISDTDRSKNWFAGLFYSQLFDILCMQENPQHIRFILDDFVCAGRIPDFDYKMAMIRSRNISAVIVVQDEAQLEKEYDKAAQGIITNCDSYVFLGASNVDICDVVARRFGNRKISEADVLLERVRMDSFWKIFHLT